MIGNSYAAFSSWMLELAVRSSLFWFEHIPAVTFEDSDDLISCVYLLHDNHPLSFLECIDYSIDLRITQHI